MTDMCRDLVTRERGEDCSATNDLDNLSGQQITRVDSEVVEYYVATDVSLKNTFDTERCPQCSK